MILIFIALTHINKSVFPFTSRGRKKELRVKVRKMRAERRSGGHVVFQLKNQVISLKWTNNYFSSAPITSHPLLYLPHSQPINSLEAPSGLSYTTIPCVTIKAPYSHHSLHTLHPPHPLSHLPPGSSVPPTLVLLFHSFYLACHFTRNLPFAPPLGTNYFRLNPPFSVVLTISHQLQQGQVKRTFPAWVFVQGDTVACGGKNLPRAYGHHLEKRTMCRY